MPRGRSFCDKRLRGARLSPDTDSTWQTHAASGPTLPSCLEAPLQGKNNGLRETWVQILLYHVPATRPEQVFVLSEPHLVGELVNIDSLTYITSVLNKCQPSLCAKHVSSVGSFRLRKRPGCEGQPACFIHEEAEPQGGREAGPRTSRASEPEAELEPRSACSHPGPVSDPEDGFAPPQLLPDPSVTLLSYPPSRGGG